MAWQYGPKHLKTVQTVDVEGDTDGAGGVTRGEIGRVGVANASLEIRHVCELTPCVSCSSYVVKPLTSRHGFPLVVVGRRGEERSRTPPGALTKRNAEAERSETNALPYPHTVALVSDPSAFFSAACHRRVVACAPRAPALLGSMNQPPPWKPFLPCFLSQDDLALLFVDMRSTLLVRVAAAASVIEELCLRTETFEQVSMYSNAGDLVVCAPQVSGRWGLVSRRSALHCDQNAVHFGSGQYPKAAGGLWRFERVRPLAVGGPLLFFSLSGTSPEGLLGSIPCRRVLRVLSWGW